MADLIQYKYEENLISFEIDEEIMVNATQMAKPFGKKVNNFIRMKQTQDYIEEFSSYLIKKSETPISVSLNASDIRNKVLKVVKGKFADKKKQGTWMHQELALKFAAWLSPKFEVWVFQQIKTLLKMGSVSLNSQQEDLKAYFRQELVQHKNYLEQTFATKADLKNLGEYLINENDWNQAVTVADNFMKYVATMLQKIEEYQVHQDILLSNLEEALNLLDVDILKKAVREILAGAKMLKTEIPTTFIFSKKNALDFIR